MCILQSLHCDMLAAMMGGDQKKTPPQRKKQPSGEKAKRLQGTRDKSSCDLD